MSFLFSWIHFTIIHLILDLFLLSQLLIKLIQTLASFPINFVSTFEKIECDLAFNFSIIYIVIFEMNIFYSIGVNFRYELLKKGRVQQHVQTLPVYDHQVRKIYLILV